MSLHVCVILHSEGYPMERTFNFGKTVQLFRPDLQYQRISIKIRPQIANIAWIIKNLRKLVE